MLSRRGTEWAKVDFVHGPRNDYDPKTNRQGVVSFANAESCLMHDELARFLNQHNESGRECCSYDEGYTGTVKFRTAMAMHMKHFFNPFAPIDAEDLTVAAGVTARNESCALVLCDAGATDSLLLGQPGYGTFNRDMGMRKGVKLEYVLFNEKEIDRFSTDCVARFDAGLLDAKRRGVDVKGLVICNPHDPLGQCYSKGALMGLLKLCNRWDIHLLSDEIYALSVYSRGDDSSESFTSVLSLEIASYIRPELAHVLYGMSKDFGAAGMRLGCVYSKNEEFKKAIRSTRFVNLHSRFCSPSQFSMHLAEEFLSDQRYVESFLQTSHKRLSAARTLAESLLDENKIAHHQTGNAGLFLWLDLSPYLDMEEAGGDAWKAQDLLLTRIRAAGVQMANGKAYNCLVPGRFRLIFCLPKASVREGIRRLSSVKHKQQQQ